MKPEPEEIEKNKDGTLRVKWRDGHEGVYPPDYLRLRCHCAACVEEWSGRQLIQPEGIPDDIRPLKLSVVGQYALHIDWSDGHSTGMYSYDFLRSICPCADCRVDESDQTMME